MPTAAPTPPPRPPPPDAPRRAGAARRVRDHHQRGGRAQRGGQGLRRHRPSRGDRTTAGPVLTGLAAIEGAHAHDIVHPGNQTLQCHCGLICPNQHTTRGMRPVPQHRQNFHQPRTALRPTGRCARRWPHGLYDYDVYPYCWHCHSATHHSSATVGRSRGEGGCVAVPPCASAASSVCQSRRPPRLGRLRWSRWPRGSGGPHRRRRLRRRRRPAGPWSRGRGVRGCWTPRN